jgi:putative ABC transport system permease protein
MSRWFTQIRLAVRSLFRRPQADRELDEEFQYHLERQIEENLHRGLPPEEARYAAMREMGAIAKSKEECRDMRRVNYIDDLLRDLRYAGRNLLRSPGFTALAVLIMALGIGANTAVFSVVNTVLLKPLAYRDPDRIVTLSNFSRTGEAATALPEPVSIPDVQDWHHQSSSFEAMAYYNSRETAVMSGSTSEYARVTSVSPEFFRVLAIAPVIGRPFTAEEMKPGTGGAVLISYAYWQTHFGGDPAALGQAIRFSGPKPIVGVLPPGFGFPNKTDLWVPWINGGVAPPRGWHSFLAVARLKTEASLEQAQTEMTLIARRLEQQYPDINRGRAVAVTRMRDSLVGDVRLTLYLLFGAVSVVLLIACANTATLLLAKATARTREVALRAALGASRQRIVRQLVTETLLLAFVAGALGLLLAYGGSKVLVAVAPADVPRLADSGVDRWVLAFTLGISMVTSLIVGLVPAVCASRVDLNEALKLGGTRSVMGGGMVRMRGVLVVAEIALAVVLVSGAGLLIKSFVALHNVALGFRPEKVLVMRATVPGPLAESILRARQFFGGMLSEISRLPGVLAAGATMAPPGKVESTGFYFVDHMPAQPDPSTAPAAILNIVTPGTFAALGIPLEKGRDFDDSDTVDRSFVAVVNEALVRQAFSSQNPLGRTIYCPFDSDKAMTIIGIAGDVRQSGPAREPMPECYMTYAQHGFNGATLSVVVRTAGDPNTLTDTLQRLAREKSPDVPMKFTTMESIVSENVAVPRFRTLLLSVFAGLALCLALAGVYGVMAYAVGQRSKEIGVRMALGANRGSVVRLVLGQGMILTAIGLVLGLAGAFASARLLTTMLFQVRPTDPMVYLAVTLSLTAVALLATYVPARRACTIDPLATLRQE